MAKGAQPHGFIYKTFKAWRAVAGTMIGIRGCARCGVLVHDSDIHAAVCSAGAFCPDHYHCAGCGHQVSESGRWNTVEGPGMTWVKVCSLRCEANYIKGGPTAPPRHERVIPYGEGEEEDSRLS
jgi:hypothetical protein